MTNDGHDETKDVDYYVVPVIELYHVSRGIDEVWAKAWGTYHEDVGTGVAAEEEAVDEHHTFAEDWALCQTIEVRAYAVRIYEVRTRTAGNSLATPTKIKGIICNFSTELGPAARERADST